MKRCLVKKDFTMRGRSGSGRKTRVFRKGEILYLDKKLVPEAGEGMDPVTFDTPVPARCVLMENRGNAEMFDRYEAALSDLESAREASAGDEAVLEEKGEALEGAEEIGEVSRLLKSYLEKATDAFRSSLDLDMAEYRKRRALRRLMAV